MTFRSAIAALLLLVSITACKREPAPVAPSAAQPASQPAAAQATVRVAAAADLSFALDRVIADFQTIHPNIAVVATYGSSGNFFAQLSAGAPFDLFLSADIGYPTKLAEHGLGDRDGVFHYARGRIVVWVTTASPIDLQKLGIESLLDPSVKKIAVANPDHAPYGRAAVAALKSLQLYDKVKDRLVFGENIAQTAQFIDTGSADIGIIAESLAVAPKMKDRGRSWTIPPTAYPPIEQGGIILASAKDLDAARQFRDYLISAEGKRALQSAGFAE